jgi:NAD(P)-dependent dehydrogenase (short-subunit alcohol dehydrogenase family)
MTASYTDFSGKHVLVTGAARGIGLAIARAFAGEGARVSVIDKNDAPDVATIQCDLSDSQQVDRAFSAAVAKNGAISILVNNAGVDRRMALGDQTADEFRWMLALNLEHHAQLARLAAPGMADIGGGAIINMSSTAFMKLAADMTAYHASKAGIIGLTRGLARDLGGKNIRVNAIAPGRIITERVADEVSEEWLEETKRLQCIPTLIRPNDIAEAALWLASGSARMITGQTLIIDGGWV